MANITRFDPVGEMVSLRSAMDRLFEDSFVSPMSWRTISGGGETITPPIDVHETAARQIERAIVPYEVSIESQHALLWCKRRTVTRAPEILFKKYVIGWLGGVYR